MDDGDDLRAIGQQAVRQGDQSHPLGLPALTEAPRTMGQEINASNHVRWMEGGYE